MKMDELHGTGWFFVGEFWKDSLDDMSKYLERMGRKFSLFDAPLVYNFSTASKAEGADLRKIFDDTLVMIEPVNAVVGTPSYLSYCWSCSLFGY
jgi:alpha-amylase